MYGDGIVTDATVNARYDNLRLWLVVSSVVTLCSFIMLSNSDNPLNIVGMLLFAHCIVALPVLYSFHLCAVVEEVRRSHGQEGATSSKSVNIAFLLYIPAVFLLTYRLCVLYVTCSFTKFRLHLNVFATLQLVVAFALLIASMCFVEMSKRARVELAMSF